MQKKKGLVRTLEQSMAWRGMACHRSLAIGGVQRPPVCLLCTLLLELQVHGPCPRHVAISPKGSSQLAQWLLAVLGG